MRLSQLIERNRRHSDAPYILLLECALPTGITLRFARDTQSHVWPRTGSECGTLFLPFDAVSYAAQNVGDAGVTLCIQGSWRGYVALEVLQHDGAWCEITRYTKPCEESFEATAGSTFRLQAGADFRGKAHCHIGALAMPLWQKMAFDFDDFKTGQDARRGTVTISVSNASGLPLAYVDELEDWRKLHGRKPASIRLLVVNTALLDDPEPVMQLSFVDCGISCPAPMDTVKFVLGARNIWSWPLMRKVMQQYCGWKRTSECPHVAECDHTLTTCRDIYNNVNQFGGFPMVGKGALYGS